MPRTSTGKVSSRVYYKSIRRTIKSSIGRFLSILFISFLGAGVLAGLMAVAPNMRSTGDAYYDKYNVMDARMLSTFGFDDADVQAIRDTKGVNGVNAGYTIDAVGNAGDKDYSFRLNSLPTSSKTNAAINQLHLIDGRLPQADNEIVVLRPATGLKSISLGGTITLNPGSNDKLADNLSQTRYTVVGIAESPLYLSFMQGDTAVGNGRIDFVGYVRPTAFVSQYYTELYLTINGAKQTNTFEPEYTDQTKDTLDRLEALAKQRQGLRQHNFQEEIQRAEQEYETKKQEATAKLDQAALQLQNARSQLASAKTQLSNGWAEYDTKKASAETQLAQAKAQLDSSRATLDASAKQLDAARAEYNKQRAQYEALVAATGVTNPAIEAQLAQAKAQIDQNAALLAAGQQQLAAKQTEYDAASATAASESGAAYAKLEQARQQIIAGERELPRKQAEYDSQKSYVDRELTTAEQKINDAKQKLADLGSPKWYVLDRDLNQSYVTYKDDIDRMTRLATVFPVVFYLVAVLVCLTTMTRMVDEDRVLIGTFKALGYSNGQIAGKYLLYASVASVVGSVIGIFGGFWLLPTIIWNAYGIVFALPHLTPGIYGSIGVTAVLVTVLVIALATTLAIRLSLKEMPAALMQPKAPKSGKRIWLEYITPIWSRLSFSRKVTVRNIGLNKKRLAMSLVGIVGCTALVVTAFGARHAMSLILNGQFGDIFHYNVTVGYDKGEPSNELQSRIANADYFTSSSQVASGAAQASTTNTNDDADNISIVSPKDTTGFERAISLIDSDTNRTIAFSDDSVIITKKLSMNLHLKVGDTLWLRYLGAEVSYPVTVSAITQNYTFNYAYLGKSAYEQAFKKQPTYNQYLAVANPAHTDEQIRNYLDGAEGIGAISFTNELMGNVRTSISSINIIIWVLIVAAGLLTFVVLYNLININIGERQRELATLKVLGFYDRETYAYIFRETIILSIIGVLLGLGAGYALYQAVVTTVEPDVLLLTRQISWDTYLASGVLTIFFTWVVNQFMKPKIRHIDMLESLKSVE